MMPKEELLQYIHKTADMGVSGLEDVLPKTEDQELFFHAGEAEDPV